MKTRNNKNTRKNAARKMVCSWRQRLQRLDRDGGRELRRRPGKDRGQPADHTCAARTLESDKKKMRSRNSEEREGDGAREFRCAATALYAPVKRRSGDGRRRRAQSELSL